MHFKFKHLDVFRAVMIHGSATHAALEVNITQSAVSRNLKEFEEIVGFKLFDRERTGLRPTREAEQLFKDVQRAYRAFTDVATTAKSIKNKEGGHLRIAALAVYVDGFLSRSLPVFLEQHPGTKVQLIAEPKAEIEKLVATEQVDLGITALPLATEWATIRKSTKRHAVCIFPKNHPLCSHGNVTLEDLLDEQLIQLVRGSPLRIMIDKLFSDHDLQSTVNLEMETQRAIVNMVSSGGGVGIIEPDILSDQDRDLVDSRPLAPILEWSIAIITAKRKTPMRIADDFIDWISHGWE